MLCGKEFGRKGLLFGRRMWYYIGTQYRKESMED